MERIHVSVRARPLSTDDATTSPWKISSNSIFIPNHPSLAFEFDKIFREDCKTVEVYEARTKEIVAAAVRGFNGTVFAYGQTNSGKTHTMRGSPIEPGVIPLAVHDLFDTLYQDESREFLLRMSYLEIYNEDINDLLAPEHRKLQIHENIEKGIFVAGLREEIVASPQQVLEMMEFGESHRHIGETNMNLHSSRSHTIFRMIIESREKMQDEGLGNTCDAVRVSVLNLVDLAGSERASKTGAEGVRLKEGSHINKSLMTLGTVIKKLSEGVEIQGGHVPYRDSKLTRILQPALGGNANTAIICNITLAPIHADETKSSLQFASRALRVTNCAHVNEVLTDAALLKRQKKEIEELRSKLKASHSDHSEEEILNLRNTLLKSELERERIALELEEEKKAQAQKEKVLKEQEKKIKNLSSMVLLSNRDEKRETGHLKKDKRRDTWCPGKLSRDSTPEVQSNVLSRGSSLKSVRPERETGPLLPFAELDEDELLDNIREQDEDSVSEIFEDSALPDTCTLMHVTSRKKPSVRQRSPVVVENELDGIKREYEDLLLQYETEIISNGIHIECLKAKLGEVKCKHIECGVAGNVQSDENSVNLRDPEAILIIKQLQEKIDMLEMEKSSSQQNVDHLVNVATEQNICARDKIAEIQEEIYAAREETKAAREEAQVTREQLVAKESEVINLQEEIYAAREESKAAREEAQVTREQLVSKESEVIKLQKEIYAAREETKAAREEAQVAREQLVSKESEVINMRKENFNSLVNIATDFEDLVSEFQNSKASVETLLQDFTLFIRQSFEQYASLISSYQNAQFSLKQEVLNIENEKLLLQEQCSGQLSQIEELNEEAQKHKTSLMNLSERHELEMSDLLSHIEGLEKDIASLSSSSLAKEKENLRKDFEKTKTKLKDTESKLKNVMQDKTKLEAEKASTERELKRLHSQKVLLERDISKQESFSGRRNDSLIVERSANQSLQEEYNKLEVFAIEMESTIASLEEEMAAERAEKEEALCRNDGLYSEITSLTEKLEDSNSQLENLQKDVMELKTKLEESSSDQQQLETSVKKLLEEKEELAMHLATSLLEMEEEKAIWSSKEKALRDEMEEKIRLFSTRIESISKEMSQAKKELESSRLECVSLADKLRCSEENVKEEKERSMEKSLEIDRLGDELRSAHVASKQSQEDAESIEKAKLKMRLRGTQARLDAFCLRHKQAVNEAEVMNRKFEEAAASLKEKLTSKALEVLDLKKQLSSFSSTMS